MTATTSLASLIEFGKDLWGMQEGQGEISSYLVTLRQLLIHDHIKITLIIILHAVCHNINIATAAAINSLIGHNKLGGVLSKGVKTNDYGCTSVGAIWASLRYRPPYENIEISSGKKKSKHKARFEPATFCTTHKSPSHYTTAVVAAANHY